MMRRNLAVLFLIATAAVANDDQVIDEVAPQPGQRVVAPASLLNSGQLSDSIQFEIRNKVDDLRQRYDLTPAQQAKALLIGGADGRRLTIQIQQAHQRGLTRRPQQLFGPDSFLVKALPNILNDHQQAQYQADLKDQLIVKRRSHIESVVRRIEQHVVLDIPQIETLTEFLWEKIPPLTAESAGDPRLVLFLSSQIPDAEWKQRFTEEQWPQVKQVLLSFEQLSESLRQEGVVRDDQFLSTPLLSPAEDQLSTGKED